MPRNKDAQKICFCFLAPLLVIFGGLAQMYVTIIGGQAFPMQMFPGHEVTSTFFDGVVGQYSPSVYEWLLGMGGVGITFVLTVVAVRAFKFMPQDDFHVLQMRRSTD
jgi:Ni/Fe-hydrogenase subunit HybB-like protein